LEHGQLDKDITIDHLCGNTRCIEPLHLRPQTVAENSASTPPSEASGPAGALPALRPH
jgi:hypothetical protein